MKAFDEDVYGKIAALLPPERLAVHLGSFERQLRDLLSGSSGVDDMKNAAHKLISQAGMLGFGELSERCATLEAACERGGPVEPALAEIRPSAEAALAKLEELQRGPR